MQIIYRRLKRPIVLVPYTTAQEKEMLLASEYIENCDELFTEYLRICGIESGDLSSEEKKVILYKLRELSVGDSLEINLQCPHCKTPQSVELQLTDYAKIPTVTDPGIRDLHRLPLNELDFMENFCTDPDMPVERYDWLWQHHSETQSHIDLTGSCTCLACRKEILVNLGNDKTVAKMVSEDSIKSLYKTYENLIYFGKWSKTDIDSLLPFERKIFISLLQQSLEKQARQ